MQRTLAICCSVVVLSLVPSAVSAQTPPQPSARGAANVRVLPADPSAPPLVLLNRGKPGHYGEPTWVPICQAPCVTWMMPGKYILAAAPPGAKPYDSDDVNVDATTDLRLQRVDRARMRLAGGIVLGASLVSGVALLLASEPLVRSCVEDYRKKNPYGDTDCESSGRLATVGGLLVGMAGGAVGTVLLLQRDFYRVEKAPLGGASLRSVRVQASLGNVSATARF